MSPLDTDLININMSFHSFTTDHSISSLFPLRFFVGTTDFIARLPKGGFMAQRGAAIPVLNGKTKLSPVVKRRGNFLEGGGGGGETNTRGRKVG